MSPIAPKICAVITARTCSDAREALALAGSCADIAELRLDYLEDFDFENPTALRPLLEGRNIPVIITCRLPEEGGIRKVDEGTRLRLLIEGAKDYADYCDIEASRYSEATALNPDRSKLIVSYHNFSETPEKIDEIYSGLLRLPAAVHKIATRAVSVSDNIAIFRLLERAQNDGAQLIALAMGTPGLISRILGPSRGSFLTFAALERGAESAPGQLTVKDLKSVYRLHSLTPSTTILGIIGNPVLHSASPAMHNAALSLLGLDAVYLPIEVDEPRSFFRDFVNPSTRRMDWNLRGFSVTIPHKIAAMELVKEIYQPALNAGAVNTVVLDGEVTRGYNTDIQGAIEPLARLRSLAGARCAVIGAGGAARAVVCGLIQNGGNITVFARNPDRASDMARQFGVNVAPLESLNNGKFDVLINTTPVGMGGHSEDQSPVDPTAFTPGVIAYDLVYNPPVTRFLKDAHLSGCTTLSGLDMLVAQAGAQFKLWTGLEPPLELMMEAAKRHLGFSHQAGK